MIDISTYYRLDETLLTLIERQLYAHRNSHQHRFIAVFKTSPEVQAFASVNPGVVWGDYTHSEATGSSLTHYTGKSRYYFIGISLSEITWKQFQRLSKKVEYAFLQHHQPWVTDVVTKNPNLYFSDHGKTWKWGGERPVEIKPKPQYLPMEQEWLALWTGFDHYYYNSDDLAVYRIGRKTYDEYMAKGVEMGITPARLKTIYRECFTR